MMTERWPIIRKIVQNSNEMSYFTGTGTVEVVGEVTGLKEIMHVAGSFTMNWR